MATPVKEQRDARAKVIKALSLSYKAKEEMEAAWKLAYKAGINLQYINDARAKCVESWSSINKAEDYLSKL